MDYYNKIDNAYLAELHKPMRKMYVKMEILSHYEGAIGEITSDLSSTDGSITINKEQGCRRSCSLSIIDRSGKYIPQKDSSFWYNRKFKIFIGLQVDENIYWFPQGVFVTKSANSNGRRLNVEGVDKYGFLDGTLNARMCLVEYQASVTNSKKGTNIATLIKDTLMLDLGNNIPLDPVEPIIDPIFYNVTLYDDIVIDEGGYLGEIFDKIAEMYGANIYYDVNGRLRMERVFNYNLPSWYRHLSPQFELSETEITETDINYTYNYDGVNIITVTTDNTSGEIYSYTAKNENPQSPVNINAIGYKGLDGGTYYIPLGDTNEESGEEKCRQQAEYMLLQHTCMSTGISYNLPITPHLNVDNTVRVSNDYYNFDKQLFIVNSITMPLSATEMSIEATNLQWLPFDTDCISIYCETLSDTVTISYNTNGGKDKDGNTITYKSISQPPNKQIVLQGGDMYNENKLFAWTDSQGNKYNYGDVYIVPNNNATLIAQWITGNEVTVTNTLSADSTVEFQSMSPSRCLIRYDDNEVARRNTNAISTFKKNYSLGTHDTTIVSESDDLTNFDNAFDKETTTKIDCSKVKATYLTSPMGNRFENMTDFVFPANLAIITTSKGVLSGCKKLTKITFPIAYCEISHPESFLANSTFVNGLELPYTLNFVPMVSVDGQTGNEILKGSHVVGNLNIKAATTNKCVVYVNKETTSLVIYPATVQGRFYLMGKGIDGDLSGLQTIQIGRSTNINDTDGFASNTSANINLSLDFQSGNCTTKIPKNAFNGYSGNTINVVIYGNVTDSNGITLESGSFCNMPNMTKLPMTNRTSLKTIPENCMNNLASLTSATTGYVVDVEGCNNMSNLTTLRIESSCEKVNGFNDCPKLRSLSFMSDGKVKEIGGLNNNSLTTFYIPNTALSVSGVNNCSALTTVVIGNSLTSFTGFNNCPKLNKFTVNSANTTFKVINDNLYQGNKLCRVPMNKGYIVVENGTTEIMSNAIQVVFVYTISVPSGCTLASGSIKSQSVGQIIFHTSFNAETGKYNNLTMTDFSTLDNVQVGTIFTYGNGITDTTNANCLPVVKYCAEHNINYVDMNETNANARGAIGISGNAELDGDN
ncbi:MAG: hypothetical protein ACLUNP_08045 [Ruminococcus sp.]